MTLVFGKLVNEFNHSDQAKASRSRAVVDKYAYWHSVHLLE